VDEAMLIGDRLIARLTPGGDAAIRQAAIHLKLAHAAVDGTRWAAAGRHVGIAGDLLAADPEPGLSAETAVLDAEIALAADDAGDRARALAESVLATPGASTEIRCRALELLGRGIAILDTARQRGPAPYRGLWPLLLAAHGDPRAGPRSVTPGPSA
jgi:hypothetical protein